LHPQTQKDCHNKRFNCKRELSSVGSEHLVYTQRVGGSNPSAPTKKGFKLLFETFFALREFDLLKKLLKDQGSRQIVGD
jgi:hypothetical protein